MLPSNRSKFEKMKNVAALQTQKGPWSCDVSSTVKKGFVDKIQKVSVSQQQALQQQKGPWSRQENSKKFSQPPPPTYAYKKDSKHNKALALQELKGPWNQDSPPNDSEFQDVSSHTKPLAKGSTIDSDFMDFEASMRHENVSTGRQPMVTHVKVSSRLGTAQHIMCFCNALSIFRKQWAVMSCSKTSYYFHAWRRNVNPSDTTQLNRKRSILSPKERQGHSVLLWLAANSKTKHLRHAWKKWTFAVVAVQNQEKNAAIESLSTALGKENEQYKQKLVDIMAKVKHRDSVHRHNVVSNTMHSFFRIKAKMAMKRRFDTWSRVTWQISYNQTLRKEKYKMEIGFQAISSEKEVMKETEIHSSHLQSTLLCLVAFSAWKLKMKQQQFSEQKKQWSDEKRAIQDNLLSLQKSLLGLNRSEREMVESARVRGLEMYSSLNSLSEKLDKCTSISVEVGSKPSLSSATSRHGHGHASGGGIIPSGGGILKKSKKKLLFEEIT